MNQLFRRKRIQSIEETGESGTGLRRTLGVWQLTALGIGAIIGAGIFSGAGTAVSGGPHHLGAGPAC
jgi:APA family basic amino acid/polyamine antiporter